MEERRTLATTFLNNHTRFHILHIHKSNRKTYTISTMTIDIIAIISPKADKADRVRSAQNHRRSITNIHHPGRGTPQASSAVRQSQRARHAALPPAARNERRCACLRCARDVTPPPPNHVVWLQLTCTQVQGPSVDSGACEKPRFQEDG
jgi:hypothetical protein